MLSAANRPIVAILSDFIVVSSKVTKRLVGCQTIESVFTMAWTILSSDQKKTICTTDPSSNTQVSTPKRLQLMQALNAVREL
jgi:hypothetical protein